MALSYLPFKQERLDDVLGKLHVHPAFVRLTKNPRSQLLRIETKQGSRKCIVFILSVDSKLSGFTMMCLAHFPDTEQVYGIYLGCEGEDFDKIEKKLAQGAEFLSNPFLYISVFLEIEKEHRFQQVNMVLDTFIESFFNSDFPIVKAAGEANPKNARLDVIWEYRRVNTLEIALNSWKAQLQHLIDLKVFTKLSSADKKSDIHTIEPREYLQRIQEFYIESASRCQSITQATSLAFQRDITHITRDDARITTMDGKQMKSIAVLTMIFLPATFLATFMAAPSGIEWDGAQRPWLFWAIAGPMTAVVVLIYSVWTYTRTRQAEDIGHHML
ncbi:hypothetical protein F4778DRAFT_782718 [Xylariomycetidae sp. FL2044]|nr:hypothetical protein F4778DRAFT_782718 [Xylariomycetidae sp. FL2044]